jgi:hypothetical protein
MHVPDLIWDSTESMGRFGCVSVSICLWLLKRWQCPVRASLVAPSRCPLTRPKTIGALITYEDLTSESWRHGCDRHYWVAVPRDLHPLRPNSKTAPCRAVAGTRRAACSSSSRTPSRHRPADDRRHLGQPPPRPAPPPRSGRSAAAMPCAAAGASRRRVSLLRTRTEHGMNRNVGGSQSLLLRFLSCVRDQAPGNGRTVYSVSSPGPPRVLTSTCCPN